MAKLDIKNKLTIRIISFHIQCAAERARFNLLPLRITRRIICFKGTLTELVQQNDVGLDKK